MKKPFFAFLIVAVLGVFSYVPNAAEAVKPEQADLPQVSGTYDVPGHSKIKMRVFVHNAKPQPPVCIGSDPASDSVVAAAGWKLQPQWTYALNVDSAPASFKGQLPAMARSAFAEWSTDSGVNFSQLANTNVAKAAMDGKNVIAWGRVSGGSALAVT
ncbi:MAG: hypothetical protein ACM3KM_02810, partial [Acidobacteriaceae bacterium]